ncbi:ABC transporter permease subunit [Uruburuella testudinis]|uniref:ABC transporter permease subunit n=1 Tax=Uruburuella testudinis TaxID=1282863 RepID=A0ABY4DPM4_9NEIS|nr:ABC transporter permease subunit [Uruburuella testudinis]UOO80995.1 ABC transporter permease subunit [Uruburuella testudinis]
MPGAAAMIQTAFAARKARIGKHWGTYAAAVPFVLLVVLFLFAPLGWVVVNAFRSDAGALTLANVQAVFDNAFYLQSVSISLKLSFISSVAGLLIGFQGAYSLYAVRNSRFGRALVLLNSLLSNFSGVPLAFAIMIVFGSSGVMTLLLQHFGIGEVLDVYSYSGILVSYIYFQIPLAVLLLYPSIEALKQEWLENAYLLGSSFGGYFVKVALPVLMPALLGTFIILFANALGAYATAYALTTGNFNILPIRIAALIAGNLTLEPNMAAALALVLVSLMLVMTLAHQYLLRRYQE